MYTTYIHIISFICSSIDEYMGFSITGLLRIKLQQTQKSRDLFQILFSLRLVIYHKMGLLDHMVVLFSIY